MDQAWGLFVVRDWDATNVFEPNQPCAGKSQRAYSQDSREMTRVKGKRGKGRGETSSHRMESRPNAECCWMLLDARDAEM